MKEKKHFTQDEAPTRSIPNYAEFSTKHMLSNKYVQKKIISEYFPEQPLQVDRKFFWAIFLKVDTKTAEQYIQSVMTQHHDWEVKKAP